MIQLGQDNDAGPPVGSLAFGRAVIGYRLVFAAARGGNMRGVKTVFVLQDPYNEGRIIRINDTDYFVLEVGVKQP